MMKTLKKVLSVIAVVVLVVCVVVLPMCVSGDTKADKQTVVNQADCSYALICKEDEDTYRTLLVTDSLDKAQRIENNESQYSDKQTVVNQADCSYALICKEDEDTYRTLLVTDSLDKAQRIENNESQYYSDLQIKKFDKNVKELTLEDVDDYINSETTVNI